MYLFRHNIDYQYYIKNDNEYYFIHFNQFNYYNQ
jgi:hypothetical protein